VNLLEELDEHAAVMERVRGMAPIIEDIADRLGRCVRAGGTVFWFGNGGSASQAEHLAAELVGRYEQERAGLRSLALTTDGAVATAIANDYAFDDVFARQLAALGRPGDAAVALSTSGNSVNVLRGVAAARELGAFTVGLTGCGGGRLAEAVDSAVVVPDDRTSRIQEAHLFIGHLLCGAVEAASIESGDAR
jgi:D-sedoheptulose 7-phosphate isomerase